MFDDLRLDADREVQVPGMETAETSKVSKIWRLNDFSEESMSLGPRGD